MEINSNIFSGKVKHCRLSPKVISFDYNLYGIIFPLSKIKKLEDGWRFGINRKAILSFQYKDYGLKDGSSLEEWVRNILKTNQIGTADGEILLLTIPRVFGYGFNPINIWFCLDKRRKLRAVICEVNNTYGETHLYLCRHQNEDPITNLDYFTAEKNFHVSPFFERLGHYRFKFDMGSNKFGIFIDYFDSKKQKQLATSLTGIFKPYSSKNRRNVFWRYPFITFRIVFLIYWNALKLFSKKIKFISKPLQKPNKINISFRTTKGTTKACSQKILKLEP